MKFNALKNVLFGAAASVLAVNANAALIEIYESNSSIGSIAQAESIIAGSSGPNTSANSNTIWFSDVGTNPWGGTWGAGSAFPGGHNHTFVMTATGTINTSVYSHIFIGHDDGIEVSIDDSVVYDWNGNTDFRNSGWYSVGADVGERDFDLLFWENGGEADLFVLGYTRAGQYEAAYIGDPTGVPEPASIALFGLGLAALGFSRRKLND